MTEQW